LYYVDRKLMSLQSRSCGTPYHASTDDRFLQDSNCLRYDPWPITPVTGQTVSPAMFWLADPHATMPFQPAMRHLDEQIYTHGRSCRACGRIN
jgi:hypothetical protein